MGPLPASGQRLHPQWVKEESFLDSMGLLWSLGWVTKGTTETRGSLGGRGEEPVTASQAGCASIHMAVVRAATQRILKESFLQGRLEFSLCRCCFTSVLGEVFEYRRKTVFPCTAGIAYFINQEGRSHLSLPWSSLSYYVLSHFAHASL